MGDRQFALAAFHAFYGCPWREQNPDRLFWRCSQPQTQQYAFFMWPINLRFRITRKSTSARGFRIFVRARIGLGMQPSGGDLQGLRQSGQLHQEGDESQVHQPISLLRTSESVIPAMPTQGARAVAAATEAERSTKSSSSRQTYQRQGKN